MSTTHRPDYFTTDRSNLEHIKYDVQRSRSASLRRHNESVLQDERRQRRRARALSFIPPAVVTSAGLILFALVER